MKKLSGLMIVCIPLYAWGSESFSVNLSLYETPKYAMNTSYDNRYSPISIPKSLSAVDCFLEGVAGFVGGVVGGVAGLYVVGAMGEEGYVEDMGAALIGAPIGILFGTSGGVILAAKWMGNKGSYWKSFMGTAVGIAAGVGGLFVSYTMRGSTPFMLVGMAVSISLPVVGGVWGYHLGGREE